MARTWGFIGRGVQEMAAPIEGVGMGNEERNTLRKIGDLITELSLLSDAWDRESDAQVAVRIEVGIEVKKSELYEAVLMLTGFTPVVTA